MIYLHNDRSAGALLAQPGSPPTAPADQLREIRTLPTASDPQQARQHPPGPAGLSSLPDRVLRLHQIQIALSV